MSGLLKTVRYTARPHANGRTHKIPADVVAMFTDHHLDGRPCIFEIMVISHSGVPQILPPVIVKPTSADEVRIGAQACRQYPETFSADQYLVIDITPL